MAIPAGRGSSPAPSGSVKTGFVTCHEAAVTCNGAAITGNGASVTGNEAAITANKTAVTCNKALVTCNEARVTCNKTPGTVRAAHRFILVSRRMPGVRSNNIVEDSMSTSNSRDYVPRRDADFDGWLENLTAYVVANATSSGPPPRWTHIPQPKVQQLVAHNDDWHTKHVKLFGPHTEVDILAKQLAREVAEPFARSFTQQYLKFDPVTDLDRANMRIAATHATRSPTGKLIEEVMARCDSSMIRQLIWHYWIKGSEHHAKPPHAYGVECIYARLDHPPVHISELINREISTASPVELKFDEEERGGKVYCCFRWLGTKEGNEGEWSEIFSAVIP